MLPTHAPIGHFVKLVLGPLFDTVYMSTFCALSYFATHKIISWAVFKYFEVKNNFKRLQKAGWLIFINKFSIVSTDIFNA